MIYEKHISVSVIVLLLTSMFFGFHLYDNRLIENAAGNVDLFYGNDDQIIFNQTSRGIIRINNNTDFTNASGVVRGNGSEADPYLISGWAIDGKDEGCAIFIGNTTKHFIISNCSAFNASGKQSQLFYRDSGIMLYNSTNGTVEDSQCSDNYIDIITIRGSNITLNNITSVNSNFGFSIENSTNLKISENNCSGTGIILDTNSNNNYVYNNTVDSISITGSNNNTLTGNMIYSDTYGIILDTTLNTTCLSNVFINSSFTIKGDKPEYFSTHNITTNNTVKGNPVYYYNNTDLGSAKVPTPVGQVICANTTNLIIDNLIINDGSTGILIAYSSNIDITDCSIKQNQNGIEIIYSDKITVENNKVDGNLDDGLLQYGYGQDLTIRYNSFSRNKNGIEAMYLSKSIISENTCNFNTGSGLFLTGTDNITITGNNLSENGDYGLSLEDTNMYNTVNDNECWFNSFGIRLYAKDQNTTMKNNNFKYNNVSLNNKDGILIDIYFETASHANVFSNNFCYNNADIGIHLERSYNNTFIYNLLDLNLGYGLLAGSTTGSNKMHHNNYLSNRGLNVQAYDDGVNNSWDDGKEGNYWNEYKKRYPAASSIDGIWNISYDLNGGAGSMDRYPFVYLIEFEAPVITDQTPANGYTGNGFTFACFVYDNVGILNVTVLYWYGEISLNTKNISFFYNDPVWLAEITLPQNSTQVLNYIISAVDLNGNWRALPENSVTIIDNDQPIAVAKTDKSFYLEGETVIFNGASSHDNIGIVNYTWYFVYKTADVYLYNSYAPFKFNIPGEYLVLLKVKDAAGETGSDSIFVNITRREAPAFRNLSYSASMLMNINIKISVAVTDKNGEGIRTVLLNYTDVHGNTINTSIAQKVGSLWTFLINGQSTAGTVSFFIWSDNYFGKTNRTPTYKIEIIDEEKPIIKNVGYPVNEKVNVTLKIEAVVTDNDDISIVRLVYNDVYNVNHNVTMALVTGVLFAYIIPGQTIPGKISFHIWAMDINGNVNETKTYSIDIFVPVVKDTIKPYVVKTVPENNRTDVPINTLVRFTFSETMERISVEDALSISPHVNYTTSWSSNDKILTLAFSENLSYNQTYNITIGLAAKDMAENPLANVFVLSFMTELPPETITDMDGDGMDDEWERGYGFDPTDPNDAFDDEDNDALINVREYEAGTDPFDPDTDDDGMPDGWEVLHNLDPLRDDSDEDPDGDGYTNLEEYQGGSDPFDSNSIPVKSEPEDEEGGILGVLAAVLAIIILVVILLMIFALRRYKIEDEDIEKAGSEKVKKKEEEEFDREVDDDEEPLYIEDGFCPECGADMDDDEIVCPECEAEFAWEEE